jgi:hypothetical protein
LTLTSHYLFGFLVTQTPFARLAWRQPTVRFARP